MSFLSTLPARGATCQPGESSSDIEISIHAPREGSDMRELGLDWNADKFLSTLPARGATRSRRR